MNVRKPTDYRAMFKALDGLMMASLPQMELYCEIGRLVSDRPEKDTAVAAAEYLSKTYPGASGFSPRNLRRMRDFYRAYEGSPNILAEAMTIGWTQNVAILEAELTLPERAWYIQAVPECQGGGGGGDKTRLHIKDKFLGDASSYKSRPTTASERTAKRPSSKALDAKFKEGDLWSALCC